MLDKVIRIQHPGESRQGNITSINASADEVLPADSTSNVISAVIPEDQTVVSGATIALRLTADILVNKQRISAGQLVYGLVDINNERMQIHIHSIRHAANLYTADLQVYDMDGIAGIHIPGLLSRDVAKTSADQGVSSLNITSLDASPGAQAANAGVQTVKSFFSRKVRLTRVSVRAGYRVLLRNTHTISAARWPYPSIHLVSVEKEPPGFVPGGSFLSRCRLQGMELTLQGICLKDSLLWFGLQLKNNSPIDFIPEYVRWLIRDRHRFRRTAIQELTMEPVWALSLLPVPGDSVCRNWSGFSPFALARDKELVVEIGEKNGGRVLALKIDDKQILKATKISYVKR